MVGFLKQSLRFKTGQGFGLHTGPRCGTGDLDWGWGFRLGFGDGVSDGSIRVAGVV